MIKILERLEVNQVVTIGLKETVKFVIREL